jgi:hypothetical protein
LDSAFPIAQETRVDRKAHVSLLGTAIALSCFSDSLWTVREDGTNRRREMRKNGILVTGVLLSLITSHPTAAQEKPFSADGGATILRAREGGHLGSGARRTAATTWDDLSGGTGSGGNGGPVGRLGSPKDRGLNPAVAASRLPQPTGSLPALTLRALRLGWFLSWR